jgi:D-hexose-6-phosphate mutarotase
MEFQALLHNYIQAPSDDVVVTPLQNLVYFDKTDTLADGQPKQKVESRAAVDIRQGTDSVYENAPQDYEIKWGYRGLGIKTVNLKDVVVWNPQDEGRKMADMEQGGWYSQKPRNSAMD